MSVIPTWCGASKINFVLIHYTGTIFATEEFQTVTENLPQHHPNRYDNTLHSTVNNWSPKTQVTCLYHRKQLSLTTWLLGQRGTRTGASCAQLYVWCYTKWFSAAHGTTHSKSLNQCLPEWTAYGPNAILPRINNVYFSEVRLETEKLT